ncbi:MAG TPA: RNA methyltransferase [Rhizomicrobium sp.]|nr:RNA methyltransferase [Rhizomicrobium sp.]
MHDASSRSLITDPNHPLIQRFRSLQTAPGRAASGLYVIEGIRHVFRAAQAQTRIEQLLIAPKALKNPAGRKLARRLRRAGTPCAIVAPELYERMSLAAAPQGIAAILRQKWTPLNAAQPNEGSSWLAVERLESPGNLGTMIRTSEAAGAAGLILIGCAADPHDPVAVRATMGSLFSQKLVRTTAREFVAWSGRRRLMLVGASPQAARDYRTIRYEKPLVILVGSEKRGLSDGLCRACNSLVRIPILRSGVDSLNVAVAAGILLYAALDQRPPLP